MIDVYVLHIYLSPGTHVTFCPLGNKHSFLGGKAEEA
jgi:hypothetical protein